MVLTFLSVFIGLLRSFAITSTFIWGIPQFKIWLNRVYDRSVSYIQIFLLVTNIYEVT